MNGIQATGIACLQKSEGPLGMQQDAFISQRITESKKRPSWCSISRCPALTYNVLDQRHIALNLHTAPNGAWPLEFY